MKVLNIGLMYIAYINKVSGSAEESGTCPMTATFEEFLDEHNPEKDGQAGPSNLVSGDYDRLLTEYEGLPVSDQSMSRSMVPAPSPELAGNI